MKLVTGHAAERGGYFKVGCRDDSDWHPIWDSRANWSRLLVGDQSEQANADVGDILCPRRLPLVSEASFSACANFRGTSEGSQADALRATG